MIKAAKIGEETGEPVQVPWEDAPFEVPAPRVPEPAREPVPA
jgi:hypothetical protein